MNKLRLNWSYIAVTVAAVCLSGGIFRLSVRDPDLLFYYALYYCRVGAGYCVRLLRTDFYGARGIFRDRRLWSGAAARLSGDSDPSLPCRSVPSQRQSWEL